MIIAVHRKSTMISPNQFLIGTISYFSGYSQLRVSRIYFLGNKNMKLNLP